MLEKRKTWWASDIIDEGGKQRQQKNEERPAPLSSEFEFEIANYLRPSPPCARRRGGARASKHIHTEDLRLKAGAGGECS
jgi:hypothetical protein